LAFSKTTKTVGWFKSLLHSDKPPSDFTARFDPLTVRVVAPVALILVFWLRVIVGVEEALAIPKIDIIPIRESVQIYNY
jgi:hypothetical protein